MENVSCRGKRAVVHTLGGGSRGRNELGFSCHAIPGVFTNGTTEIRRVGFWKPQVSSFALRGARSETGRRENPLLAFVIEQPPRGYFERPLIC